MLPSDISKTQKLGTGELAMQTFSSERLLCPARHRSCTWHYVSRFADLDLNCSHQLFLFCG